jgi:hypothetical protein
MSKEQMLMNLNIFRPADFDEIDRSKGAIQRFMVEDRANVCLSAKRRWYVWYLQQISYKIVQAAMLTTTNDIITTNNIRYLEG